MKSVIDWLKEEIQVGRGNPVGATVETTTIATRLAELIAVNGGKTVVERFGHPQKMTDHPYGRVILTVMEALELVNLNGIMSGFCMCQDDLMIMKAAQAMIQNEIIKTKSEGFNPEGNGIIQIYSEDDMKVLGKIDKQVNMTLRV